MVNYPSAATRVLLDDVDVVLASVEPKSTYPGRFPSHEEESCVRDRKSLEVLEAMLLVGF